jgi:hypothetical protein
MYATVRRYEGIRNPDELGKRVGEGFVPLISEHRGFVAYYCVDDREEGVIISTSVFEDQADEEDSNGRGLRQGKSCGLAAEPAHDHRRSRRSEQVAK